MNEEQILCACSAYEQKYYLNPRYASLPVSVQEELQIMAVTMTEDVGGVFTMEFDEDGNVESVEQQTLCIVGETTYTLKFTEDDKETFFKASN